MALEIKDTTLSERRRRAMPAEDSVKRKDATLADERLAATSVLRWFAAPPRFPKSVSGQIFNFLGTSCVWTLQALAIDPVETKRAEKKARTEAQPRATKPVPHDRFTFTPKIDNVDKVAAYCAGCNFVKGLVILKKRFGFDFAPIIAAGAASGGHMKLFDQAFRATIQKHDASAEVGVIRSVIMAGQLRHLMESVRKSGWRVYHGSLSALKHPDLIAHAFNFPNTMESRVWLLQRFAENYDDAFAITAYRVTRFDISVDQLNSLADGMIRYFAPPKTAEELDRENRERLYAVVYFLALQTNNQELAMHARMRAGYVCETPLMGSCSVEFWRRMREVDYSISQPEDAGAEDAKMLFAHACETGNAKPSDYDPTWETVHSPIGEKLFLTECLGLCLEQGHVSVVIEFVRSDIGGVHYWTLAVRHNSSELLHALEGTEPRWGEDDFAVSRGSAQAIELMKSPRGSLYTCGLPGAIRVKNALSDTCDRALALDKIIEKAGLDDLVSPFGLDARVEDENDDPVLPNLRALHDHVGTERIAKAFAQALAFCDKNDYIGEAKGMAKFAGAIGIGKEQLLALGAPESAFMSSRG
ncbi:MAG: hypothetical protein KGL39_18800 [Patescibacteria group bacterium]|nr:hypothetical protein [Patescibacteria group bacterium]